MSIPEWVKRSKDGLLVGILVLSSTASFGLGVLAGREQGREAPEGDFWIEQLGEQPAAVGAAGPAEGTSAAQSGVAPAAESQPAAPAPVELPPSATPGSYVASKTGTKYYLPWCGTAGRIKEENKVWFATKAEAEAAGYEPAANCKGL